MKRIKPGFTVFHQISLLSTSQFTDCDPSRQFRKHPELVPWRTHEKREALISWSWKFHGVLVLSTVHSGPFHRFEAEKQHTSYRSSFVPLHPHFSRLSPYGSHGQSPEKDSYFSICQSRSVRRTYIVEDWRVHRSHNPSRSDLSWLNCSLFYGRSSDNYKQTTFIFPLSYLSFLTFTLGGQHSIVTTFHAHRTKFFGKKYKATKWVTQLQLNLLLKLFLIFVPVVMNMESTKSYRGRAAQIFCNRRPSTLPDSAFAPTPICSGGKMTERSRAYFALLFTKPSYLLLDE